MSYFNQIVTFSLIGLATRSTVQGTNLLQNGSFEDPAGNYEYVPGGMTKPASWQTVLSGVEIFT